MISYYLIWINKWRVYIRGQSALAGNQNKEIGLNMAAIQKADSPTDFLRLGCWNPSSDNMILDFEIPRPTVKEAQQAIFPTNPSPSKICWCDKTVAIQTPLLSLDSVELQQNGI